MYLELLWLVLVVSLDSLLAGFSYGLRNMKMTKAAWLCIAGGTAALTTLAMGSGSWLARGLSPIWAERIGGLALVGIGLICLVQSFRYRLIQMAPVGQSKPLAEVRLPWLGVVLAVWRDPLLADRDASGRIETAEGITLGLALGLDTLPAGLSAALLGCSPVVIPLFTIGTVVLCWLGVQLGRRGWAGLQNQVVGYLPGVFLIILGLWHI